MIKEYSKEPKESQAGLEKKKTKTKTKTPAHRHIIATQKRNKEILKATMGTRVITFKGVSTVKLTVYFTREIAEAKKKNPVE